MNQPSIVVVGSLNADLVVRVQRHPHPGETLLGSGGTITAGGKGANQALAAALQGANVTMIGAVGEDSYAAPATEYLRRAGVNMRGIAAVDDECTGLAVITVSDDGENAIIVIPGANAIVNGDYVAGFDDVLHDAAIVLLQGEIPASGFARAVELAGGRVVVNLAPVIEVPKEALLKADPLMANEHEGGLILKQLGVPCASEEPCDIAQALVDAGFKSVVMTLGSQGALVADASGLTPIPTPKVEAVDTTGAGDAFAGAFVAKLAEGADLVEAAHHAARVGAFAATRRGAQASYPGPEDELPSVE